MLAFSMGETASGNRVMISKRMALHPFDEADSDIALVQIAFEHEIRHGGDQMLLPVLGLYNVHVVRRCGHDLGQRAEQRLAVVDRKTQKIGDEQTALRQLRVRTRDGDDLIAASTVSTPSSFSSTQVFCTRDCST